MRPQPLQRQDRADIREDRPGIPLRLRIRVVEGGVCIPLPGARVHVWTVNDRSDAERLIELGVDGIVTDDLVMLKDVLVARDLWEGNT